jgi:hypothetical protein
MPLAPVVPASLCEVPGPLARVLSGYKAAPVTEARRRFAAAVGDILVTFLARHQPCLEHLAGGPLELAVAVPPTLRPGEAPLHQVPGLGVRRGVLVRGPAPLGHLRASVRGFQVPEGMLEAVAGRRILVVDDIYTTGARAQSAAAALRLAGAASVVVVACGRAVRRGEAPWCRSYWRGADASTWHAERCCHVPCRAAR